MKKTFRLIGMGLMALAVSVNFAACGSDDDDDDDGSVNGSRIVSITTTWTDDEDVEVRRFDYDNAGRIIKVTYDYSYADEDNDYTTYEYSDSKIIETEYEDDDVFSNEYTLTDGKITSCKKQRIMSGKTYTMGEEYYEYDDNNYMTQARSINQNGISTSQSTYYWEDGNLVAITQKNNSYAMTVNYTYTDINASAGYNTPDIGYDGEHVLYNQGYFGTKSKNLIKSEGSDEYNYEMKGNKVIRRTHNDYIETYSWK